MEIRALAAARIAKIRKSRGMKQSDLARVAEQTQQAVSLWEKGEANLSLSVLVTIACALDVEPWVLLAPEHVYRAAMTARVAEGLPEAFEAVARRGRDGGQTRLYDRREHYPRPVLRYRPGGGGRVKPENIGVEDPAFAEAERRADAEKDKG